MSERPSVYRVTRACRYGGGDRRDAGDLWLNPPDEAIDALDRCLERLDENGRVPREELGAMHYQRLQQLAAQGDIDSVDGNSAAEDIVDAYALVEPGIED